MTAAADRGLVDIHDRRPLVLTPEAAREWMRQDLTAAEAAEITEDGSVSADDFTARGIAGGRQCEQSGASVN